ncbi:MAG: helix-turn-helix transcriptional regulator [Brucella anthropi]
MINWSQSKLAEVAGIARATLAEFEAGKRAPIANNLAAIKTTLESAGIVFIDEAEEGPGVRLKKVIV